MTQLDNRISKLFEGQIGRLAETISRDRGTEEEAELRSLTMLASTIEGSVTGLFEVADLRPEIVDLLAKAFAAGWVDGAHREFGAGLPDAVHRRLNELRRANHLASGASLIGGGR